MTFADTAIRAAVCFGWTIAGWHGHAILTDSMERARDRYERDVTRTSCHVVQRLFPELDMTDSDCERAGDRVMQRREDKP